MGLLDHYKQYEAMPVEEVNARLKEGADERKRQALAVVEPLDLSMTTWPHLPDSRIVNAITFAARRGLQRMPERHATPLRTELALRHEMPVSRVVVGDGAAALLAAATQALLEPGDELITPWPSYGLYPVLARRSRARVVPVAGFGVEPILGAVNEHTRVVALCNPNDPTGELLGVEEVRALLDALPERVICSWTRRCGSSSTPSPWTRRWSSCGSTPVCWSSAPSARRGAWPACAAATRWAAPAPRSCWGSWSPTWASTSWPWPARWRRCAPPPPWSPAA